MGPVEEIALTADHGGWQQGVMVPAALRCHSPFVLVT
jgi:hypothetical protein